MQHKNHNPSGSNTSFGHNTPFSQETFMPKLYRFEIETLWIHPENKLTRRREMIYDFTTNILVPDERTWFNGQDFYNPKRSPHIYADWDKAELAYSNLDWLLEDWEPLADLMQEGSNEHIEAFRLILQRNKHLLR